MHGATIEHVPTHHNCSSSFNCPNHASDSNYTNKIGDTIKLSIKYIDPRPHFQDGNKFQTQYRYGNLILIIDAFLAPSLHSPQ
jgi:hypothetical protein